MARASDALEIVPVLRTARADLNGTTAVQILAAPPRGETYLLRRLNGVNTTGTNRLLRGYIRSDGLNYFRFSGTVVTAFPYTARLVSQPGPHDYFGVMTPDATTDAGFWVLLDSTGTDPVQLDYEVVPAGAHANAKTSFNGANWVEMIAAPPRGTTYAIRGVDTVNSAGGTLFLHIAVLKDSKRYYLHTMRGLGNTHFGHQSETTMPRNPEFIGCLDDPDESLQVRLTGVGTQSVSVDYEIHPQ